jgi:hypothetical protein
MKRATCYTHTIMARPEQRDPVRHYLVVAEALGLDGAGSEVRATMTPDARQDAACPVERRVP